jgi:hypothetical protein
MALRIRGLTATTFSANGFPDGFRALLKEMTGRVE